MNRLRLSEEERLGFTRRKRWLEPLQGPGSRNRLVRNLDLVGRGAQLDRQAGTENRVGWVDVKRRRREDLGCGFHFPQPDLFDRQPASVEQERCIGRTTRLPDNIEHRGPFEDSVLEIDGQVEQDVLNADLINVAERVRVYRDSRSGGRRIEGPRRLDLGRVDHAQTYHRQRQQSHDKGHEGIQDDAPIGSAESPCNKP